MKSLRKKSFLPRCKAGSGLFVVALASLGHSASAQSSLQSVSQEGVAQMNTFGHSLDTQVVTNNSIVTSSVSKSFMGLDGAGNMQTMTFTGNSVSQSDYGRLHVMTTESLLNSYYNPANSPYVASNGDINDPNGSPTILFGLGRANFSDTLQYGGALQSGYMARYIFHVDGTNSGTGSSVGLTVEVDQNPSDTFINYDSGFIARDWATSDFAVNGSSPQKINVFFQATDRFDTNTLMDGMDYNGAADFSSTLTLAAIELVDQNGQLVSGWTVTSASGTQYNTIQGSVVPEPGLLALCVGIGGFGAGLLRRRSKRQAA